MFESFVITVREGIEIALIIGILLVYVRKLDLPRLTGAVYVGVGSAALTSVVVAYILQRLTISYEPFEGYLMFVAAAFVTTMIVWMWRTSRHIKKDIEERIDLLVGEQSVSWRMYVSVGLFTFLMVAREGVETVIFLSAVSTGKGAMAGGLGAAGGLVLAGAFCVLFVKGSVRVDIGRFLKVTAIVLLIFVAQLVVNGVHEFYEQGIFPANPAVMSIVGPIVRKNLLFILAVVCIPAIMMIIPGRSARSAENNGGRRWQLSAAALSLSVIFFLGFDEVFATHADGDIQPPVPVLAESGEVRIPVSSLMDGSLHRFLWVSRDGTPIRFFALRSASGSFSTACDACRACYNYGHYYMKDGELVCSVCQTPSELTQLAVAADSDTTQSGSMEGMGCAPLYLPSRLVGGAVCIRASDLERNARYFRTSFQEQELPTDSAAKHVDHLMLK